MLKTKTPKIVPANMKDTSMLTILSQQNMIDKSQVLLLIKILSKYLTIFSYNIKMSNIIKNKNYDSNLS